MPAHAVVGHLSLEATSDGTAEEDKDLGRLAQAAG